jgi:hypothetical protein
MNLAYVFNAIHGRDLPFDVVGNANNLQFGTMTVGFFAQLFHHTNEVLAVTGDQVTALIQSWFAWRGGAGPVRTVISFLKYLHLPQLSQANKRFMAYTKLLNARINDDLSHQLPFSVIAGLSAH